jgi:hypothetical protein
MVGWRVFSKREEKLAPQLKEFEYLTINILMLLYLTIGGMWRWRRVAVARVFALVVRCRIMMLFVYYRVGKNRDTRRESPAGVGAGRTADHLTILFSQKILAVRESQLHIPTC